MKEPATLYIDKGWHRTCGFFVGVFVSLALTCVGLAIWAVRSNVLAAIAFLGIAASACWGARDPWRSRTEFDRYFIEAEEGQ